MMVVHHKREVNQTTATILVSVFLTCSGAVWTSLSTFVRSGPPVGLYVASRFSTVMVTSFFSGQILAGW